VLFELIAARYERRGAMLITANQRSRMGQDLPGPGHDARGHRSLVHIRSILERRRKLSARVALNESADAPACHTRDNQENREYRD